MAGRPEGGAVPPAIPPLTTGAKTSLAACGRRPPLVTFTFCGTCLAFAAFAAILLSGFWRCCAPSASLEGLMSEKDDVNTGRGFAAHMTRTRIATRAAMTLERLWPLALPLIIVISLFLSVSWLGLFRIMPETMRLAVAVLFIVVAIAALYPLRFFRSPARGEIDRRIERA